MEGGNLYFRSLVKSDFEFLTESNFKLRRAFYKFIFEPGFKAVVIYRIQQYFQVKKMWRTAGLVSLTNHFLTGAEFCVGCIIGSSLIIRHPSGIVIGGGVVIGEYLIIQKGVVIGTKYSKTFPNPGYPVINHNVQIGSNSVILGKVEIGNNVTIGALTLVIRSVPNNLTVVGNPARFLESK